MKTELKKRPLKELAEVYRKDLRVNPEYQRGTKWNLAQKQSLIDSLLRGYDLPLFYIHLLDRKNKFTGTVETTVWLVDGQQRLAAITDYIDNRFSLPDPKKEPSGTVIPSLLKAHPSWQGKRFEDLSPDDQQRFLTRNLLVIEMREEAPNEARDLFIRLQAGTPLTAQEKRDAWPGDFTTFVIRHAGKPNHPESSPKPFFKLVSRGKSKMLDISDGEHYVDGLADTRKFFAGLAMTIMVRQRFGLDFVDLKGKTINEFYKENFVLSPDDPAVARVVRNLDRAADLPGFQDPLAKKPISFQMAFHFALLVDSLLSGNYVPIWRDKVVKAFQEFQDDSANARYQYRTTREVLPHYDRFVRLLGGSGSDTADVIRMRHAFFLQQVYPKITLKPLDSKRLFDSLEKEIIWIRDGRKCKNPACGRLISFNEVQIHHIQEHSAGGPTVLENGVLVCSECHGNRELMQTLAPTFQEYLKQLSPPNPSGPGEIEINELDLERNAIDGDDNIGRKLRIIIHWNLLKKALPDEEICEKTSAGTVVKFIEKLIGHFGKEMENRLTKVPIIRYPLSRNPASDFPKTAKGQTFPHSLISGTDLYICTHSSNPEKLEKLIRLRSVLGFPSGSIEVSFK